MNRPKLVGITGGIGSGKSTVCKIFEVLGAKVYYADDRAKFLMENDDDLIARVKSIFGDGAYLDNRLNRAAVAEKVFGNRDLLDRLNRIVHPAVKRDFEKWITENLHEKTLLKEAALLVETGSYKELDSLVLVLADEEIRITRILNRDPHRTEEDVRKIISEQLSDKEKSSLADFNIDNNGDKSLIHQVVNVHNELIVT